MLHPVPPQIKVYEMASIQGALVFDLRSHWDNALDTLLSGYVWIGDYDTDGSQGMQIARALLRAFRQRWAKTHVYLLTDDPALRLEHILDKLGQPEE